LSWSLLKIVCTPLQEVLVVGHLYHDVTVDARLAVIVPHENRVQRVPGAPQVDLDPLLARRPVR